MAKKILIIDDEKDMVQILSMRLESCGYQVIPAYDGAGGIEKVRADRPDLIILDLMMPNMGGHEVARQLKSDELYSKIPIIVLTAAVAPDLKEKIARMGVFGYVTKPFEPEELIAKIREALK